MPGRAADCPPADGSTWTLVSSSSPFGEGAIVQDVASRNGLHVAVGEVGTRSPSDPGATTWAVWISDDGLAWERLPTLERPEPCETIDGASTCLFNLMADVVAPASGWMIVAWDGAAWTSTDGRSWEPLRGWPGVRGGYTPPAVALGPGVIVGSGSLPGPWHAVVVVGTIEP